MAPGIKRQYRPDLSDGNQQSRNITIEQYLAGKDPYRVAPPGEIPVPWPFRPTPNLNRSEENNPTIRAESDKICARHSITEYIANIDTLKRKGFTALTTSLVIETENIDTTHWKAAAAELRTLVSEDRFKLSNGETLGVEIRHHMRVYADYSACLPADETLKRYLDEIEPKLIALAKETLGSTCTSIAYHMRGCYFSYNLRRIVDADLSEVEHLTPPRPTVLIYVKPGTVRVFEDVETRFVQVMDSPNFPDMAMHIEILPGTVSNAATSAEYEPRGIVDIESTMPGNGISIGASSLVKQSGTLGGWVRLTSNSDSSQVMDCVMSAYHIFAKADAENEKTNDVHGIGFSDPEEVRFPDIKVVWPSNNDEVYTRSLCEQYLARNTPLNDRTKWLQTCLAVLNEIQGSGRVIGKVRYASGYAERSPSNGSLDWVLIPSPHTSQANKPPDPPRNSSEPYHYWLRESDRVRTFAPDVNLNEKSNWVMRQGRTINNQGLVNTRHRVVFWEDARKGKESFEMEILPVLRHGDVCDTGDEGSWLVNLKHELVGMLIGKCEGDWQNGGIATPIKDLVKDIERRTNCTVSLP